MPQISYIWYGPPAKNGHDIQGCLNMSRSVSVTEKIVFFCPADYVQHYQLQFSLCINVTVTSIEGHVRQYAEIKEKDKISLKIAAQKVQEVIDCIETSLDPIKRDLFSVKEIISLFVLVTDGGFIFDSNIQSMGDKPIKLPVYSKFAAPVVDNCIDCWMMFAPPNDPRKSALFLVDQFHLLFFIARKKFSENLNSLEYHDAATDAIIQPLWNLNRKGDLKLLKVQPSSFNAYLPSIIVSELNIIKFFNRTHVPQGQAQAYELSNLQLSFIGDDAKLLKDTLGKDINPLEVIKMARLARYFNKSQCYQFLSSLLDRDKQMTVIDNFKSPIFFPHCRHPRVSKKEELLLKKMVQIDQESKKFFQ